MAKAPQYPDVDELRELITLFVDRFERTIPSGVRHFTDQERSSLIANALQALRSFPLDGGPIVAIRLAPGLSKDNQRAIIEQLERVRDLATANYLIADRMPSEIRRALGIVVN